MRLRNGSAARGAGVALACLLPGLGSRARAVVASYAVGWPLDKPGLQVFVVVPDENEEPWKRALVPLVTSGASWTVVMLLATSAVRRAALPAPAAGILLGGGVAVADSLLADLGARMRGRATAARTSAAAAESD